MRTWLSRLSSVEKLIVVTSVIMAALFYCMSSRILSELEFSNFLFFALGTEFLSVALFQGARGERMIDRMRNAPLLAHYLSGAGIAVALCGLVLMHFGQIGP
jgi:hypothetical protein